MRRLWRAFPVELRHPNGLDLARQAVPRCSACVSRLVTLAASEIDTSSEELAAALGSPTDSGWKASASKWAVEGNSQWYSPGTGAIIGTRPETQQFFEEAHRLHAADSFGVAVGRDSGGDDRVAWIDGLHASVEAVEHFSVEQR